ncbi:MAG: carboxypeptidase-like regulatory domain-containing protein [Gemmatimonadales bacterium]
MRALVLALLLSLPGPGAAGRVVRRAGADTLSVPGAMVLLHRVGPVDQGAIDSMTTDAAGRFAFRFVPDTGAAYLVSARWAGIEHFAPPLGTGNDTAIMLMVADTSAAAPVTIAARHVVVSRPASDGARTVVDLIILSNVGMLARVRAGEDRPSWSMLLPPHAVNVRVAESDFSPTAFDQHDDTLLLFAPIPPGDREIFLDYQLAPGARSMSIPVDAAVGAFTLMSEEVLGVGTLERRPDTTVNEHSFHRWTARGGTAAQLVVRFPSVWAPGWLAGVLAATLAAGLLLVTWHTTRRRAVMPAPRVDTLLDQLAQLDAAHFNMSGLPGDPTWDRYLRDRSQLKAALKALLPR